MSHQPGFFRRQDFDGFTVVFIDGEVDVAVTEILGRELRAAVDEASPHLLIDLSNVTFLDSSALSTLVMVHKHAVARGGETRLVGPNPRVAKLLKITQLDHVLRVHDTIASASEGLGEPAPDARTAADTTDAAAGQGLRTNGVPD